MSTVKATNFQHPSASAAGITLGSDGSVVLPSGFTGGIGSNVVTVNKIDTFSTTSATAVDVTGLAVTITPTTATSQILIIANVFLGLTSTVNAVARLGLKRDSTVIAGNAANSIVAEHEIYGTQRITNTHGVVFLDSPATTSATTYQFTLRTPAGTAYVNRSGEGQAFAVSNIAAIEVAA